MSNKRNKRNKTKSKAKGNLHMAYYGYQNAKGEGVESGFTSDNEFAKSSSLFKVPNTKKFADNVIKASQKMLTLEKASGESLDGLCKALLNQLDIMSENLAIMANDMDGVSEKDLEEMHMFMFSLAPMNIIILETFGYIKTDNFNGASYMARNTPYKAKALTW